HGSRAMSGARDDDAAVERDHRPRICSRTALTAASERTGGRSSGTATRNRPRFTIRTAVAAWNDRDLSMACHSIIVQASDPALKLQAHRRGGRSNDSSPLL